MAFVDDCIKNKWHRRDRFSFSIPSPFSSPNSSGLDSVSPKKLIDGIFGRKGNPMLGDSPLRQTVTEA